MMHHPRIASIDFMAQYASKLLSQQKDRLASDSEPVRRGGEERGREGERARIEVITISFLSLLV